MFPSHIALFAFNRPVHLLSTLNALAGNQLANESELTIFCDGPRNDTEKGQTDAVRVAARQESKQGRFACVHVVERPTNLGCAESIISGLTEMFATHDRLIVIEDDILCSPHTLLFLNNCLDKYEHFSSVFNIAAWSPPPSFIPTLSNYPYDVYAFPRFSGWGWATWKDRWEKIDWKVEDYKNFSSSPFLLEAYRAGGNDLDVMLAAQMAGELDTWDIRVDYSRFKSGCVGINPIYSYTENIGHDGTGTHCGAEKTSRLCNDISVALSAPRLLEHICVNKKISEALQQYYSSASFPSSLGAAIVNKIRSFIKKLQRFYSL